MEKFGHKGNNVHLLQFVFMYGDESVIKTHRVGNILYYRIPNVISFRKTEPPMEDKKYGLYRLELNDGGYVEIALDSSVLSEDNKLTQVADIDNQISDNSHLLTTDVFQSVIVNRGIMNGLKHEIKHRVEKNLTTSTHIIQQPAGKLYDITAVFDAS